MAKLILVPVDLEHEAHFDTHLQTAAALAEAEGGRLAILTVQAPIPDYVRAQLPPDLLDTTRHNASDRLKAAVASQTLGVPTEVVALVGRPGQEIVRHAEAERADLIVIASRDPHGATHLFGSVASYVVRHAHCSVYVLRERP